MDPSCTRLFILTSVRVIKGSLSLLLASLVTFLKLNRLADEGKKFRVLLCGRGDAEDFLLQGFDIAAKAVAALSDTHLVYVGAEGKESEIKDRFLNCGIPDKSLTIRSFLKSRESLT